MDSQTVPAFWEAYRTLPPDVRRAARRTYQLWRQNPRHPSLRFEPKGPYWSVRVTRGWRALAGEQDGVLYWFWIGPHDRYERQLKR